MWNTISPYVDFVNRFSQHAGTLPYGGSTARSTATPSSLTKEYVQSLAYNRNGIHAMDDPIPAPPRTRKPWRTISRPRGGAPGPATRQPAFRIWHVASGDITSTGEPSKTDSITVVMLRSTNCGSRGLPIVSAPRSRSYLCGIVAHEHRPPDSEGRSHEQPPHAQQGSSASCTTGTFRSSAASSARCVPVAGASAILLNSSKDSSATGVKPARLMPAADGRFSGAWIIQSRVAGGDSRRMISARRQGYTPRPRNCGSVAKSQR
jgi:hypothetical protein